MTNTRCPDCGMDMDAEIIDIEKLEVIFKRYIKDTYYIPSSEMEEELNDCWKEFLEDYINEVS